MRRARKLLSLIALGGLAATSACGTVRAQAEAPAPEPRYGLVIHGGAGTILRENMTPEREAEYRAKLTEALQAGNAVLERGGSSLDAVEVAINLMEDSPLFNSGRGAVLTDAGTAELDASIMDGRTRAAGAVAGVTNVKNPIDLARAVMEKSPHVMMAREGAEAFAAEQGLELVPQEYFVTEQRRRAWERARERRTSWEGHSVPEEWKFGTVGAVALDRAGNLAAGTSTGGMSMKRWGRIGDSPVIGAGTYADNASCAVSATGHGEYFIRAVVAYDICAKMKYQGLSLEEAARTVILEELVEFGGDGGVIAMDARGNIAMPFNTAGMYRGYLMNDGTPVVEIFKD